MGDSYELASDPTDAELEEAAQKIGCSKEQVRRAVAIAAARDRNTERPTFSMGGWPGAETIKVENFCRAENAAVVEIVATRSASGDPEERRIAIEETFPIYYRKLGEIAASRRSKERLAPLTDGMDTAIALLRMMRERDEIPPDGDGPDGENGRFELALDIALAEVWQAAGRPRLVLTESLAAILSLTRSPPLAWDRLPYPAMMLEVPRRFLPLPGPAHLPVWIFLGRVGRIGIFADGTRPLEMCARAYQGGETSEDLAERSGDPVLARVALRLAANVTAFVTQHRECVVRRSAARASAITDADSVFDVRPPADLQVSRVLRDHAAALVAARSVEGARRVLSHVVRGHWKHQVHGAARAERKLIFVAPYARGEESLGRVADRITKLEGP
jgi:hypothetical protein